MKKLISLALALVMILSLSVTAFAAEGEGGNNDTTPTKNNSITINNAKPGETYAIYKMFDLKVNSETNPTAYTYTVNSAWADFFAPASEGKAAGDGNQYITVNAAGAVTINGETDSEKQSNAAALAKAAAAWTDKPDATHTVKVAKGETTAVFSDLADGYWLITSTLGTIAMAETTPDAAAVTINEKNPEDTIEKEVKEDSDGEYGESNDAQIGDTVEFKSTVKIVKGTRNVVVHDKMYTLDSKGNKGNSGMTYVAGSVAIVGLTKGTDYTVDESPDDGDTFDITFNQGWIDKLNFGNDGYEEFVITYTAKLTGFTASVGGNAEGMASYNMTYVSYGNESKSEEDITITETHRFSIYKHAADSEDHLAGAVFQLKKGNEVVKLVHDAGPRYRVADKNNVNEWNAALDTFTTVDTHDIIITGVDSDSDYTLVEIKAPDGYNKLTDPIPVTVNADNSTRIDVVNNTGTELPSTGGMGTTLFYVLGGLMVLGAVVVLVTKKRMGAAE